MKQSGGVLAKGWLLGLQFYELFKDGLYFEITKELNIITNINIIPKYKIVFIMADVDIINE